MQRYLSESAANKADRLEFAFSFELQASFSSKSQELHWQRDSSMTDRKRVSVQKIKL